jgi:hypothetical protein
MYFEFSLAVQLGKTVSQLRAELSDAELVYFAAYYELERQRQKQ